MASSRLSGLRVAIVGLGPAGAYAAGHLLANRELDVTVDAFERLPTPWGLVRSGVAPDHPNIKAVTRVYEKTADEPGLTFHGNVEVGRDITRGELLAHYHAVIYAVGTPGDRPLGLPGEALPGSAAATEFVGWYNGHPDHRDHAFELGCRRAVVIGNGNVALDVARLLTLPPAQLAVTDAADHAIAALAQSRIEEVVVIGRRGPEQAAFTHPELRELGRLDGVGVAVDPGEVAVPAAFREARPSKSAQRNLALLAQYAQRSASDPTPVRRRIALRFLLSPVRIVGTERVEGVEVVRNRLERRADGSLHAVATEAGAVIPAGLVLRAVGYRGVPLPGVPFDERRGLIAHDGGRILGPDGEPTREYVVGWAKRGPTGVIGTNKKCALETVRALVQDLVVGRLDANVRRGLPERLQSRQRDIVGLDGWRALDAFERAAGERAGRPRVKLTRVPDMLAAIDGARLRDDTAAERLAALLGEDQPAGGGAAASSASASHSRSASARVV